MGLNKYKYFISLDGGVMYRQVTLVKPILVSGKKEDTSFRYSLKTSPWKMVRYENTFVYDHFIVLLVSPSTLLNEIIVKCELWDDWENFTKIIYIGYVPLSGIAVNQDNGTIEITPSERSDYDWYDQHKNDKHDIYNEINGTYESLSYHVDTVTEEYWVYGSEDYLCPEGFAEEMISGIPFDAGKDYVPLWTEDSWCTYALQLYHCVSPTNGNLPTDTDYWELIDELHGGPIRRIRHIFRETSDLPFYDQHDVAGLFTQGNGYFQPGFPVVTALNPGWPDIDYTNLVSTRWSATTDMHGNDDMVLCGSPSPALNKVSTGPNHSVIHVLKHMLQINYEEMTFLDGSGLTISSDFLTSATDPIKGGTNHYCNLRLVHNRSIKGIQDIETKGEMTLEQLIRDLCESLQLSWCIIDTTLYIEHINFFVNGFTYTGTQTIYTDLTDQTKYPVKYQVVTDPDGTSSDREHKYVLTDCPEKEIFHFPDGYDYDGQIRYDSKFVKKGGELKHDISVFMTDFAYVLGYRMDSLDDCWCLIAAGVSADGTALIWRRATGLRWVQSPIYLSNNFFRRTESVAVTGFNYPNGDLQWNNILNDLWDYQTIFQTGAINGCYPSVTFNEPFKRIKQQRELRFPRVESGEFNPYNLITTNIGDGQVESFEIDTDTDFIKVQLLYEES